MRKAEFEGQDGTGVHGLPLSHSLFSIMLLVLFLTWLTSDSTSALIYDHRTLLNIRISYEKYVTEEQGDLQPSETTLPLNVSTWLQREPWPLLLKKRCHHGKR